MMSLSTAAVEAIVRDVSEVAVHPDPATRIRELAPLWIGLFDLLSRLTDEIDGDRRRTVIGCICIPLWQRRLAEALPDDIHSAIEGILSALLRSDEDHAAHDGLVAIFEVASSTALAVMGGETDDDDVQFAGGQGSDMEKGLRPLMSMLKREELWEALKDDDRVRQFEEKIKNRAVTVILARRIRGRTKLCQKLLKLIFAKDAVDSDIETIWKKLSSSSSASIEGRVTILSAIADGLFRGELWKSTLFFQTLQYGLSDEDNFVRKCSLYLLKRGVDRAQELDLSCELLRDARGNKQTWDSFFLVIECSAEKQVHIVKQVTGRLAELAKCCGAGTTDYLIHYTWVLVLYRALFKHQNQAIAKWSACYFLETFTCIRGVSAVEDEMMKMLTGDVLRALNNPKIFQKGEGPHRENLKRFLLAWTRDLPHEEAQKFWNAFLTSTFTRTIDVIPLFFIWEAAYEATRPRASGDLLTAETLVRLAEFVERGMRNQYPLLKGGAQALALRLVMKTTTADVFQDSSGSVLKFLAAFHRQNSVLVHGTDMWNAASHWTSGCNFAPSEADNSMETVKTNALAAVIKTEDIGDYVATAVRDIASSANRPYDVTARVKMLELEFVLEIIDGPRRRKGREGFLFYGSDDLSTGESEKLEAEISQQFLTSVMERVRCVPEISDLPENERLLNLALRCKRKSGAVESLVQRSADRIVNRGGGSSGGTDGANLFAMTVIAKASGHSTYKRLILEDSRIQGLAMEGHLPDEKRVRLETPSAETAGILNEADRRLRVVHLAQNIGEQWCILRQIYPHLGPNQKMLAKEHLLEEAIKSASSGGADGIEAMQECLARVFDDNDADPAVNCSVGESFPIGDVSDLLNQCRASVFDFRKNDKFFPLLSAFVKLAFCDWMLGRIDCPITEGNFSFLMEQAELVPGIAATLAERLSGFAAETNHLRSPLLFKAAITFLLFGSLHKKEHKLIEDANRCVLDYGPGLPVNSVEGSDHLVEAVVRAHGLKILLVAARKGGVGDLLAAARHADSMLPSNRRQYENSTGHLSRHRLCQTLLVLTEFCDEGGASQLLDLALGTLVEKCVQPSVRHLSEWIVIKVVCKNRGSWEHLVSSYENAKRDRLGSIPSYLFILTQILLQSGKTDDLEVGMGMVAPWCMAQTFAIRTAAQVSFRKLYEMARDRSDLREKFSAVDDCVAECTRQGDPNKNQAKLDEMPFLTTLDPIKNFSVRDIFSHYSRIMGMIPSEWENFVAFERVLSENELIDSLGGRHEDIPDLAAVIKHRGSKPSSVWLDMAEGVQGGDEDGAIQKKVMPWMEMMEAEEDAVAAEGRRCAFPHLTLVASLVDRLPNLGGLCRTCEIFGVGRYVIGSRRFVDESDFQNTSVTAEKWVPIEEVPARLVGAFVEEKRREGYAIVGVEQTSESVALQEFEFPRKTVLLLGNERAGIPVELIGLVDHCVEIPQRGLIRSFNVHVTGALVLWEYVKQHTPSGEM